MKKLNINQIMNLLPHAYPFLLIDSVEDYKEGKIVCKKNVTINEPFFQGHFPSQPIMPGVLLVECGAQAAALMYILDSLSDGDLQKDALTDPSLSEKVGYLASIKNFKFKDLAIPGNTLNIKCKRMISLGKISEIEISISNEAHKEIACGRVLVSQK
ncbi:3-hydroxyacyl-ACP dehydratase FabZ [Lactococcus allomyrinae]|uniref:3-hydroxyacyl-ACP dehydratase FabZ n=1 Tax=Lactococcus allomyrinae TaxID=2419773 RepID=A0A387BUC1_9LACT|nr:3-hydroxyacyl-ACP dehydratase FabZ [Lactococcus allomyrinae]AYG02061.1 3-hydroxyacyl-ACP dehydratase FabZ [Lactococcus allomyrinae]